MEDLGGAGGRLARKEPKPYLIEHIRDEIARDERVSGLDVDVAIVGGRVFLEGQAATEERRDAVTEAARRAAGDMPVVNEMTIISRPPVDGAETIA